MGTFKSISKYYLTASKLFLILNSLVVDKIFTSFTVSSAYFTEQVKTKLIVLYELSQSSVHADLP